MTKNNIVYEATEENYGGELTIEELEEVIKRNWSSCPSDTIIIHGKFYPYWVTSDKPFVWYDFNDDDMGKVIDKLESEGFNGEF